MKQIARSQGASFGYGGCSKLCFPKTALTPPFRDPFAPAAKTHVHICKCHSDTKSLAWVLERLPYETSCLNIESSCYGRKCHIVSCEQQIFSGEHDSIKWTTPTSPTENTQGSSISFRHVVVGPQKHFEQGPMLVRIGSWNPHKAEFGLCQAPDLLEFCRVEAALFLQKYATLWGLLPWNLKSRSSPHSRSMIDGCKGKWQASKHMSSVSVKTRHHNYIIRLYRR